MFADFDTDICNLSFGDESQYHPEIANSDDFSYTQTPSTLDFALLDFNSEFLSDNGSVPQIDLWNESWNMVDSFLWEVSTK
jgi:hypothetical protein